MMEENRTQKQQELFQNRTSAQDFLLSKTASRNKEGKMSRISSADLDVLLNIFPNLLTGDSFIEIALNKLNTASEFSAMVIQIDDLNNQNNFPDKTYTDILIDVVKRIEEICIREKDVWGQLNQAEFGCFFPGENGLSCLTKADKLKKALASFRDQTVSIGIAAYPTTTYERHHILGNAYKALTHAAFFGPDSTISFDSVSLNISGDELYRKGDIKNAIKEFRQALLLNPTNVNVYNSLGVCYGVLNQPEKALEEFKTAISLDPEEVMALYNAGLTCTMTGDNDNALKYFVEADRIDKDVFEVAFHTGKLYFEMGQPRKGIDFLERAIKLRSESGPAYYYLGECRAAENMTDESISAFTRAIKINPNDAASLSALGGQYALQDKDLEIAILFCRQSIQIAPEEGLFRHRLGRLYLRRNHLEEALKEFNIAMALGYDATEYIEQIQGRLDARAS